MSITETPVVSTNGLIGDAKITSQVQMPVVEITPAVAKRLLQGNINNRNLRKRKIETYATAMKAGQWRPTREPIEFAEDGTLLNGQHRLHAVIESGVTILNPVKLGVDPREQLVMDTGMSRMASDVLAMNGYEDATQLAAAAKILYLWRNAPGMTMLRAGSSRINNEIVEEFVEQNASLTDSVKLAKEATKSFKLLPASVMAALHYEIRGKHGQTKADEFFRQFAEGFNLQPGSPILALRNVLLKSTTAYTKPPTELRMAWTIHAYNKWQSGATNVKIIKHSKAMEFPTID
jgi:hypothetical protein